MFEFEFVSYRRKICLLVALFLSGISCIPFLVLFSAGWITAIVYTVLLYKFYHAIIPFVSRLIITDQRYDPELRVGAYVRIARVPYDFEMTEMLQHKQDGIYEFSYAVVGNIVETNGVFVWIETLDSYVPAHANCLEIVPDNYLRTSFDAETPGESLPISDDEDE